MNVSIRCSQTRRHGYTSTTSRIVKSWSFWFLKTMRQKNRAQFGREELTRVARVASRTTSDYTDLDRIRQAAEKTSARLWWRWERERLMAAFYTLRLTPHAVLTQLLVSRRVMVFHCRWLVPSRHTAEHRLTSIICVFLAAVLFAAAMFYVSLVVARCI